MGKPFGGGETAILSSLGTDEDHVSCHRMREQCEGKFSRAGVPFSQARVQSLGIAGRPHPRGARQQQLCLSQGPRVKLDEAELTQ